MMPRTFDLMERDGLTLVFGMEWFPLLGSQLHRQAASLARRRRASHSVISATVATSVGLLSWPQGRRTRRRLCSAAAVFARLHPAGTVAAILPLPQDRLWLVAVHEGAVMARTDQLYDNGSGVQDMLSVLLEAHPGLSVQDESRSPSGLLDALFQAAGEQGELQLTARVSRRVLLGGAAVLLGAGLLMGQRGYFNDEPVAAVAVVDPVLAWRQAVLESARQHVVHGVAGLAAVLGVLYDMPVYLAGWLLQRVECRPLAAEWHCRASYRRDAQADNQGLLDAAPAEWSVSFDPMEGAAASWSFAVPALPLTDITLRGPRHNETRLVSALQAILPAFSDLRLEASQPLPVTIPLDSQQQAIPRPPELASYQRRSIQVQAPLRSLGLLLPETQHMSWERIDLQVAVADQPSLRSSGLNLSMWGVLYEIDDSGSVISAAAAGALESGPGRG